jgi:hypothetical protein
MFVLLHCRDLGSATEKGIKSDTPLLKKKIDSNNNSGELVRVTLIFSSYICSLCFSSSLCLKCNSNKRNKIRVSEDNLPLYLELCILPND